MRSDGRSSLQIRPTRIQPHYCQHALGSVMVEVGETRILCSVNAEDGVPMWMRSQRHSRGWLTAEYSMLPSATHTRGRRERNNTSGRTHEIQRIIGRSLRGVIDLAMCPDLTFTVDCDVIQADGGTRCASVTGAYVALQLAIQRLLRAGRLKQSPLREAVAGVAVGFKNEDLLVDLSYEEDSKVDLDMNIIMTPEGRILELQGTGERASFTRDQVNQALDAAREALTKTFELQQIAADGQVAED